MARSWGETSPELWARAVHDLPPEPLKFALNASLPTNANLHMWGKKPSDVCPLCQGGRQSLLHVLNNCPVAMELRRNSVRHDAVLQVIGDFIKAHLLLHHHRHPLRELQIPPPHHPNLPAARHRVVERTLAV